ncbi:MAG TPA: response regulator [Polyangia bacterium]|nr:response regulator [Polyangia bacterium]
MAGHAHILVVEDDRDLRDSLGDALRLEGYNVVCVEHGEAALRHLGTGARPCVILLDLMMPVMDGWTFRQELLKDRALSDIPVVLMTAATTSRATMVTSDGILFKPFEVGTVLDAVQGRCPTDPAS